MNRPHLNLLSATIITHFALTATAMALELPKVQFVNGDVKVLKIDGSTVDLKKGDVVKPGEKLITGNGGVAQIKTPDQGVVALRKNTEIEFKPVGEKFDVALNHGQLRTVTALTLNQPPRELKVLTPDSSIAVKNGDNETGVTLANGGQTTSQAHLGEVNVQGKNGDSLNLTPGQMMTGAGDAPLKPLSQPAPMQPSVEPPSNAGGPAVDNASLVALNAPPAPITLSTGAPTNLGTDFTKAALAGPGAQVPKLNSDPVKIPETRVVLATLSATGVDGSLTQVLNNVPVLKVGRLGEGGNTVTFTDPTTLPPAIKPTDNVSLTPTAIAVGANTISALQPAAGTTFSNLANGKNVATNSIVLSQQIGTTAATLGQSAAVKNSIGSVVQTASANNIAGAAFTALDIGKVVDLSSATKQALVNAPAQTTNINLTAATPVLSATSLTTTVNAITPVITLSTPVTLPVVTNVLPVTTPVLATTGAGSQTIISGIVSLTGSGLKINKLKLK